MSNKIYDMGFYNEQIKHRFLNFVNPDPESASYKIYAAALSRAKGLEETYHKDLYNFNLDEIEQLMKYFNCSTVVSAHTRLNNIQNYISWAIREGYTDSNINPLDGIVSNAYCKKIVGDVTRVLITEDEMFDIINRLRNFQDQAIIYALFEGVAGKELSELTNLTLGDVNKEQLSVQLRGTEGERVIHFHDDRLINILIKACTESTYWINNGERDETSRSRKLRGDGEIEILNNTHVVKHLRGNHSDDTPVQRHTILRRLADIKDFLGGEFDFLTPINIRNSGMLRSARDIYWETGKFEDSDALVVCKQYNLGIHQDNSWYYLKRNFLNLETVVGMYGEKPGA